jgi:hypothetical protein
MNVLQVVEFLLKNYVLLVGLASIIVKLTPTLKDDHFFKSVVKFMSKYLALNHKISEEDQKKANEEADKF